MNSFDFYHLHRHNAARKLLEARSSKQLVQAWPDVLRPIDAEQAYAIQDLQLEQLGPVAGWKVGVKKPLFEPTCAPLTSKSVVAVRPGLVLDDHYSGGVEVEVGFLIGKSMPPRVSPYTLEQVWSAVSQICVAVEIIESRFSDPLAVGVLSNLADLASNGAVVYGQPRPKPQYPTSLQTPYVKLRVGNGESVEGTSQNSVETILHLLPWLANHVAARKGGLKEGQIVITGSCLPLVNAKSGDKIWALIEGFGEIAFTFAA